MSSDEATVADLDTVVHEPSDAFVESTNVYEFMQTYGIDDYDELIERTTTDVPGEPDSGVEWFWGELPDYLGIDWQREPDATRDDSDGPQFADWYPGGELNIAHNTVDRHAARDSERRNKAACIWEGEEGATRELTYHELHRRSNQVANYLDGVGVEQGDTVALYMPMTPEVIAILYGCFKLGAVAVPIFSGFGVDATATRLEDPEVDVLFTADGFSRRGSRIELKDSADAAIEQAETDVSSVVVYRRFDDTEPPMT
ncbi:acetyl-CoA synthetase, partial [Halobacteriales archaeon SW_8_65_20]